MKLQEIFDQLSYGEFADLDLGNRNDGGIRVEDYPKIVPHINMALTALYKRFTLAYDEVYIQQYDHINTYYLDNKYAVTNTSSTEPIKYIQDSVYKPFNAEQLIKIERVFSELGDELYTNDDNTFSSVYTPTYNTIQVPHPVSDNAMRVIFTKGHDKIVLTGLDPNITIVDIPVSYLEPLLYYVASRVFAGMSGVDSQNQSNNYMSKYEISCQEIERLNLTQKDNTTNLRLEINGWV